VRTRAGGGRAPSLLRRSAGEGDSPVRALSSAPREGSRESCCLGLQHKAGGKFHLRLNIDGRPIVNKYREGKMKRSMWNAVKRARNRLEGTHRRQCGGGVQSPSLVRGFPGAAGRSGGVSARGTSRRRGVLAPLLAASRAGDSFSQREHAASRGRSRPRRNAVDLPVL